MAREQKSDGELTPNNGPSWKMIATGVITLVVILVSSMCGLAWAVLHTADIEAKAAISEAQKNCALEVRSISDRDARQDQALEVLRTELTYIRAGVDDIKRFLRSPDHARGFPMAPAAPSAPPTGGTS